jgi:hypothetical protein
MLGTLAERTMCRITSYINNLHPQKHQDLYKIIEQIIDKVLPLWNMTLSPVFDNDFRYPKRIQFNGPVYDPDPDYVEVDGRPEQGPNETEDDYYDRLSDWDNDFKLSHIVQPEPDKFVPPKKDILQVLNTNDTSASPRYGVDLGVNLRRDFDDTGLQVIVKLATIRLTPEKPFYEGGAWHVEGQLVSHYLIASRR